MEGIHFDATLGTNNFTSGLDKIRRSVDEAAAYVERAGTNIEGVFKRIAALAGISFSVEGIKGFVNQVVQMRSFFQDIESSMKVFLGSAEKGAEFTQKLKDYAYYNMFEFKDLAAASQQMIAYGNDVDKIIPKLDQLSNIAVGTHGSLMDLVAAYNKAKSVGYVDSQGLASWATKGVVVTDVLKEMGVQVNSNKVSFEQLNMVLDKVTGEGGMFHDLQLEMMSNISAEIGQFEDNYSAMLNEIGEKYQDTIVDVVRFGSDLIDNYQEIGKALLSLISTIGVYRAALVATRSSERFNQTMTGKLENAALDEQIAKLREIRIAKGELVESDLQQAVAAGKLSEQNALILQQEREKLNLRVARGELSEGDAAKIADKQTILALANQEAEIQEQMLQKAQSEGNELKALWEEEVNQKQKALDIAIEEYNKAGDKVLSSLGTENYDTAVEEQKAAEVNALAAAEEYQTAIEELNTIAEENNTVATELNTVQQKVNTTQKQVGTAATGAQTTAENVNTAATGKNTLAQTLHAVKLRVTTQASKIYTAAIGQMTMAMKGLGAAIMTNPIGVFLGALTLVLPYLMDWIDGSDEAKTQTEEFGEAATKATAKVQGLMTLLDSVSTSSLTHKEVMEKLKQQYEEYGIELDKTIMQGDDEAKKVEELKKHHGELIDVIKAEAIERAKANAISENNKELDTNIETAQRKARRSFGDEFTDSDKAALMDFVSSDEIEKINEAYRKWMAYNDELRAKGLPMNDKAIQLQNEYTAACRGTNEAVERYCELRDIHGPAVTEAKRIVGKLAIETANYTREQEDANEAAEQSAESANRANLEAQGLTEAQIDNKKSVEQLGEEIRDLASRYGNTDINIDIWFNQHNVPEWMKGFSEEAAKKNAAAYKRAAEKAGKAGDQKKAAEFLQKAAQYNAQAASQQEKRERQERKNTYNDRVNNAKTREEISGLARDLKADRDKAVIGSSEDKFYTQLLNQLDKKNPDKSKKGGKSGKKDTTAEDQAKERQRAFKQQAEETMRLAEEQQSMEDAIEDARIAAIQDNNKREREERRLQFERTIRDIQEQADKFKQEAYKRAEDEWNAKNKDKTKVFSDTEVGKAGWEAQKLDDNQQALIDAQMEKANAEYERMTKERYDAQRQAALDFLKEYGSIEQQKYAITQEYEKKIAEASSPAEKAGLQMKLEEELEQLDTKKLQDKIDWSGVFSDLGGHTEEYLTEMRDQLQALLDTGDLPIDEMETIQGKINDINDAINEEAGMFQFASQQQREHNRRLTEAAQAQERLRTANRKQAEALAEVNVAETKIRALLATLGMATDLDIEDGLLQVIGEGNEGFDEMSDLLAILHTKEGKLTQARNESAAAAEKAKAKEDAANEKLDQAVARHLSNINEWCQTYLGDLPGLLNELGLGGLGEKASQGLSAVNNAAGAAADFASGNYVGAALKAVSAVKDFGRILGIGGGNAAEINKQLERLSDRNEILTKSIDRLAELMGDSAGDSAIRQYEKMMELQKELEANLLKQMQLQMSYHNSHGSFNSYWGGFTQEELDQFNSRNGTDWSGDLNDLNADLAAMLEADANLWQKIKDTGKGGYGERVADWISQLAEQSGKAAQYTEQINNNLTNTSFDSLKSSFLDTLMDMEADSKAFADNLTTIMTEALVNRFVLGDAFDDWLKKWHERYAELMRDTSLTDEQRQEALAGLRTEYQLMGEELKGDAKAIQDATGYTELMAQKANEAKEAFGDLGTTFRNTLLDINATAEDFAKELSQTLIENLVDRFILNDAFNEWLEDWTNRYNEILNDGNLSQEEADARLTAMLDEALQKRGELVGQAEELRERLKALQKETEKDTTFSGLTGSWVSALMDMNKTAEDWAQDVGKMMAQKIMEEMVAVRVMQPLLDQLQEAFNGYDMATADMMDIVEDETIQGLLGKMKDMFPELQWLAENLLQSFGVTIEKEADKTFSGMTSSWVSALMDMNKTAEDWSQDIGRTMAQKIIEEMVVAARLQPLLDELQAAFDNVIAQEGVTIDDILGDKGINAALDAISTAFPELQELTRGIMERLGVIIGEENPFSSMRDSFVSSLMDMNADAESFGKEIGKTLIQQMIEQVLTKRGFQNQLDALGEQWQEALEKGDTAAIERIRQELMRLREQAGQAVQPLLDDLAELEKQTVASPFDNLRSSLLSALMDMKSDTRSFANDINNILTQAFIDKFVLGEAFDRQLEAWKKQYAAIMGDADLSDEERAYQLQMLKNMITEYSEQMKGEAQAIHDLMGTGQFAEDQSATMNMSDKATYEQMDQYLGTQMGIYIATEQGNLVRQQILQTLQSMGGITSPNGEAVSEINAKLSYTNDYLFDIKRSNNAILSLLSSRLATIEGRLGRVL